MNDVNLRIATGKIRYNALKDHIKFMYHYLNPTDLGELDDILQEFDCYIQAIMLAEGISDRKLLPEENEFILNITDNNDFIKSLKTANFDNYTREEKVEIVQECIKVIANVPAFVKLSVATDKYCNEHAIINSPTHSQFVYDKLLRIETYVQFVDDDAQPIETEMMKKILKPVIDYYRKNYAKYSTERNRRKGDK